MSADKRTLVGMEDLLDNLDPETWDESYNIHKLVAVTMRRADALLREQQADIQRTQQQREHVRRELRNELEATKAEIERLTKDVAYNNDLAHKFKAEADALEAERDSLRRDLDVARAELADRREHMRRGIKQGMTGGSDD